MPHIKLGVHPDLYMKTPIPMKPKIAQMTIRAIAHPGKPLLSEGGFAIGAGGRTGDGDGVLGFARGEPEAEAQSIKRRVKSSEGDVVVPLTMPHTSYCWFPAKPEGWTEFGFIFMYPFPHSAPFATVFILPPPDAHTA